jgi:pyruvyl transferase EpsO
VRKANLSKDQKAQNKILVSGLQSQIDEILRPLIPAGVQVAHVGYPNYWNAGDSAIWLGTRASLDRLDVKIAYQCDWSDYNQHILSEAIDDGPILLAGGGNLGDLWPRPHQLRERILQDFPDNPILQLPQSLWFDHQDKLARFQDICSRHSNFRILLREHQSLDRAAQHLPAPIFLCPDMAFGLGSFERPAQPMTELLWLSRSDKESKGCQKLPDELDIQRQDWVNPGPQDQFYASSVDLYNSRIKELLDQITNSPEIYGDRSTELAECFNDLAQLRLQRGLEILSSGKVVITDRLHGHILCLLMGIPHVVIDNRYNKISSVFESWTSTSPIAKWAHSPKEAVRKAMSLVTRNIDEPGSVSTFH